MQRQKKEVQRLGRGGLGRASAKKLAADRQFRAVVRLQSVVRMRRARRELRDQRGRALLAQSILVPAHLYFSACSPIA